MQNSVSRLDSPVLVAEAESALATDSHDEAHGRPAARVQEAFRAAEGLLWRETR